MSIIKASILLFIVGLVHCKKQNSQIGSATNALNFTDRLRNKLDKGQKFEEIPQDPEQIIQQKCEKNGGPQAYTRFQKARSDLQLCFENTSVADDLARMGYASTVKRFCTKTPELEKCLNTTFSAGLRPCMNAEGNRSLDDYMKAVRELFQFACYNEGQRIIEVLAESGLACVYANEETVRGCLEELQYPYSSSIDMSDNILQDAFGRNNAKIVNVKYCFVRLLRQCNLPTSVAHVTSLFDIVLKQASCRSQAETTRKPKAVPTEFSNNSTETLETNIRKLSKFDATGIAARKKLARMDPAQAVYAESLIHAVLREGLLRKITEDLDLCEGRSTGPRYL